VSPATLVVEPAGVAAGNEITAIFPVIQAGAVAHGSPDAVAPVAEPVEVVPAEPPGNAHGMTDTGVLDTSALDTSALDTAVLDRAVDEPGSPGLVRPGPPFMQADSWDELPDRDRENDLYQGRRRATLPWRRVLIIVALVVGVGVLFAVPMLLSGPDTPRSDGPPGSIVAGDPAGGGGVGPTAEDTGELVPAASSPGRRTNSSPAKPAATASSSASIGTSPSVVPSVPATPSTSASPPSNFVPMTLQAENTSGLSDWQKQTGVNCPGYSTVVRTGEWNQGQPGRVTFKVSVAAAGSYQMTIYSVISTNETRSAEIYVNGASVTSPSFPPGCQTRAVKVELRQGSNTIVIENQNHRGPSIDRIEITKV
jgi:hypothetical protein